MLHGKWHFSTDALSFLLKTGCYFYFSCLSSANRFLTTVFQVPLCASQSCTNDFSTFLNCVKGEVDSDYAALEDEYQQQIEHQTDTCFSSGGG